MDFWEVWCGPCIKTLPEVQKLSEKYSGKVDIIGIVCDDVVNARKLVDELKIKIRNIIGNQEVLKKYEVSNLPTYIFIDQDGIVQRIYNGFLADQIEKDFTEFLSKYY